MAKLVWDQEGQRLYETGVKNCALYVYNKQTGQYGNGVAWNGITAINETPSGAEANDIYADDEKYLSLYSAEELGVTVEAYTYPSQFAVCDGSAVVSNGVVLGQQERNMFALAYITTVGNDVSNNDYGEKIHVIYGCKASPSERAYSTINESPEAITFSWELTTQKQNVTGYKKVSSVIIDSTKFTGGVTNDAYKAIKDNLFGKDAAGSEAEIAPHLLTPDQIINGTGTSKYVSVTTTNGVSNFNSQYVTSGASVTITFLANPGYTFETGSVKVNGTPETTSPTSGTSVSITKSISAATAVTAVATAVSEG